MGEITRDVLVGDSQALQGLFALISILAIIPSAILFIINQSTQIRDRREEKHRYITDQYHIFLNHCLQFPELKLGYGPSPSEETLTENQRYQRDVLFDLLTSVFETAYLSYAHRIRSYRRSQWYGWDEYIDTFILRADYRDWWIRVIFDGDITFLAYTNAQHRTNPSQYDVRFERYILSKLKTFDWTGQKVKPLPWTR